MIFNFIIEICLILKYVRILRLYVRILRTDVRTSDLRAGYFGYMSGYSGRKLFNSQKIAKHIKKVKFYYRPILIYRTRKKISKAYFSVYSDYECGNHNVSLELYERVEWVSYTLWFHTPNYYVRRNLLFDIFVKFYMS